MLDNKLRKSSGDPQKSSKIFVHLRRSSGQSIRGQADRWPLFLVFKGVPGCIEGMPGHYGMFQGVSGVFQSVPRVFQGCSGCSRCIPGVFRGVPGVFWGVPGCSGFYRHPPPHHLLSKRTCSLQTAGLFSRETCGRSSYLSLGFVLPCTCFLWPQCQRVTLAELGTKEKTKEGYHCFRKEILTDVNSHVNRC